MQGPTASTSGSHSGGGGGVGETLPPSSSHSRRPWQSQSQSQHLRPTSSIRSQHSTHVHHDHRYQSSVVGSGAGNAAPSGNEKDEKWYKIHLFRGMIQDVKRRAPFYWSDWTDAWDYRVVPATVYMYFAKWVESCFFSFGVGCVYLGFGLGRGRKCADSGCVVSSLRWLSRWICLKKQTRVMALMRSCLRVCWLLWCFRSLRRSRWLLWVLLVCFTFSPSLYFICWWSVC